MTLLELSVQYRDHAALLRLRICELRALALAEEDAEKRRRLMRRISDLSPLLQEARELAILTARYYERSYHKNEKYSL